MEEPTAKSDNVAVALPGGINTKPFNFELTKNGASGAGPTAASIASSSGSTPSPQSAVSHKIDALMGSSGTSSSATPGSALDAQAYQQQQMFYQQQQRMYSQFNQQQQQGMPPQMQAQMMQQQQFNNKAPFMNGTKYIYIYMDSRQVLIITVMSDSVKTNTL